MQLHFTKMQGCGNDYIYLDCMETGVPKEIGSYCRTLSPRHLSVGADGIICICAPEDHGEDATMRMFNADGSEGMMCGNGIRCVAQWLKEHIPAAAKKTALVIRTRSGVKDLADCGGGVWRVNMGKYRTEADAIPAVNMGAGPLVGVPLAVSGKTWKVTCISVGNPHCVTVVDDVDRMRLEEIGPAFEHHENFPERINTEFVQVVDSTHLKMRVWERGSGETFACGTGTCATVAAMIEEGICPRDTDIEVQLLGGTLMISIGADNGMRMTGPTKTVFEGTAEV